MAGVPSTTEGQDVIENWTEITEEMVRSRLSGMELDSIRASNTSPGDQDPIATCIASVVELVRGNVARDGSNVLGPAGTIPAVLLRDALSIIVVDILARSVGSAIDEKGVRAKAYDQAIRVITELVPKGEGPSIPAPDEVDANTVPSSQSPLYCGFHEETMRRDQTDG